MSEPDSKKQKLIRAPNYLVDKLSENASHQGKTLYSYVSEIFEQAARADEMKRSLKEILDIFEILEVPKEAGAIYTPKDFLDCLLAKTFHEQGKELQQLWYHAGKWYGTYMKGRFGKPLEVLLRLLQEGKWDLNEASMNHDGEMVEFSCVSAFAPQERSLLLQSFIEGAMHSLGYKTRGKECYKGIIHLAFSPA